MPSCIVAFHVTCAFDHGLEMRTILAENDEVRFKSFCLEHSSNASNSSAAVNNSNSSSTSVSNGHHATKGACAAARPDWAGVSSDVRLEQQHQPNGSSDPEQRSVSYPVSVTAAQLERDKVSQRKQKLQELEDEFYQLVEPREVAENLGLPVAQVRKVM